MPTSIRPSSNSFLRHFNLAYSQSGSPVPPSSAVCFTRIRKRAFLAELLGSFVFLLAINTIIASPTPYTLGTTATGIGGTLIAMIALFGGFSGGFFNPAVSVGVYLSDRTTLDFVNLILYLIAEFVGGLLGATVSAALTSSSAAFSPGSSFSAGQAVVIEIIVTIILCLIVQLAAINGSFGPLAAFYIGLVVLVGIIFGGPITGGCFNPAVALAQFVVNAVVHPGAFSVSNFFLYLLCPFVGSVVSSFLFHIFYCELYVYCKRGRTVESAEKDFAADKDSTSALKETTSAVVTIAASSATGNSHSSEHRSEL
eukprot:GHVS01090740.1.p1 GENE.GHVS01090740.1~~GHVS01090740.1.p1  ORF type:complete len:312 (+),score=38.03 GHVS01090740.1:414-1349(+)